MSASRFFYNSKNSPFVTSMLVIMLALVVLAILEDQRNMLRVQRRQLRDSIDPFYLPEARFEELFRFKKDAALALLNEIRPYMKDDERKTFIPKPLRMAAMDCWTLDYYATGSYLRDIGQDFVCAMSKTMVCRFVKEISYIIQHRLMCKYIRFPKSLEEQNKIKQRFFSCTGFPGCIGAIDCTHVKIKKPTMDVECCYINRKGYFSKIVQLICDYDLKVLSGYARFGGSTHDAYLWESSKCKQYLESKHNPNTVSNWLIGDSGYPLQPWLMTPFRNPETVGQENYTKVHIQARNCVERLNGVLKKVFACLSHDRGLLVSPLYSGVIINTCLTLHNFRLIHKQTIPDVNVSDVQNTYVESVGEEHQSVLHQGQGVRDCIVRNYFN